jgi:hypothetical protein
LLNGTPVLVAEDQPFIALELALAVEEAGGVVLGPAPSIAEALDLLATRSVAGAILDFQLVGGDCAGIIEALAGRHIPTIVQSGVELPPRFAVRFPDLIVHAKPHAATKLVAQIGTMIARRTAPS